MSVGEVQEVEHLQDVQYLVGLLFVERLIGYTFREEFVELL